MRERTGWRSQIKCASRGHTTMITTTGLKNSIRGRKSRDCSLTVAHNVNEQVLKLTRVFFTRGRIRDHELL